jgi:hypothetical protein
VELAQLVTDAQQGNERARSELYTRFENFLIKYRSFFRSESDAIRLARQYPDVAAFLGLFLGKRSYHAVASRRWSYSLANQISRKVKEIIELGYEIGDPEDIDVIIDMTFFELLMKYDPKGKVRKELRKEGINYDLLSKSQQRRWEAKIPPVGFEGYLINVFKWRLFKNIEAETKGIIPGVGWCKAYVTRQGDKNNSTEDDEMNLAEFMSHEVADTDNMGLDELHIDHDWIAGRTCQPPFDVLSDQERWIIKMRFVDRQGSKEIAESIGVSPSVIRSRYNEISQKLAEELGMDWMEGVYADTPKNGASSPEQPHIDRSAIRSAIAQKFFAPEGTED